MEKNEAGGNFSGIPGDSADKQDVPITRPKRLTLLSKILKNHLFKDIQAPGLKEPVISPCWWLFEWQKNGKNELSGPQA